MTDGAANAKGKIEHIPVLPLYGCTQRMERELEGEVLVNEDG
jgi:hypothetical protein